MKTQGRPKSDNIVDLRKQVNTQLIPPYVTTQDFGPPVKQVPDSLKKEPLNGQNS